MYGKKDANTWWDKLSIKDKQKFKEKYENIRRDNFKRKFSYPHLVFTETTRISKLTGGQIYCIFRFKDHI